MLLLSPSAWLHFFEMVDSFLCLLERWDNLMSFDLYFVLFHLGCGMILGWLR